MYRVAIIRAYDALTTVAIMAKVTTYDEMDGQTETSVFTTGTTITGTGEPDSEEWLRDVLVGLLETL